jgi:hypothetical protein
MVFLPVMWKMFKLHFITIFQTPMVIGATIFNIQLANAGYKLGVMHTDDVLWWIFAVTSLMMALLPLLTVFTFLGAIAYENLLRLQRLEANEHSMQPMLSIERITMPRSSLLMRMRLFGEFLLVMPLASLFYGFLPSLISQTILLFRKHYTYVVAAKPLLSERKPVSVQNY